MSIKSFFTLSASATLVAGMSLFVATIPTEMPQSLKVGKVENEGEHEHRSIEGAIRSVYSMRLNEVTGTIEPSGLKRP